MSENVTDAVSTLTGLDAVAAEPLSGGDAGSAYRVRLSSGDHVLAKRSPAHMYGASVAEAAGLRWLAEPQRVPVPGVHGHDEQWLVMDYLTPAKPSADAAADFGRALAQLHRAGADAHGCPPPDGSRDAWIGLAPMRNEPCADWATFYAEHRVLPYLRTAVDHQRLSGSQAELIERACERLHELRGSDEPPSRLHGDLWSGNVYWGQRSGREAVWLIDPAAHGGHRETDIAMLHLFGCPHLDRVLEGYEEVYPLTPGWRERIGVHQLFPLLVHTVLFGASYGAQAVAAARATTDALR